MKSLTGMGGMGNARELAEMLRQLGRGRDTVLAHITPEEAQMLMDAGGSGDINPNTGLPEFQDADIQGAEDFYGKEVPGFYQSGGDVQAQEGGFYGNTPNAVYLPSVQTTYRTQFDESGQPLPGRGKPIAGYHAPGGGYETRLAQEGNLDIGFGRGNFGPQYTPSDIAGMAPDQFQGQMAAAGATEPGLAQTLESKLAGVSDLAAKYPRLAQAAGYSAQGLVGMLQAARARKQGRDEAARLAALGAPLRAQGQNLLQQATTSGLTPQQAAQQEASRAKLRQSAAGRGAVTGTQAGMIENQLGRQRSEMAQINYNNALKIVNLANAYEEGAIRATLAGDREADDILGAIASNIGSQLAGSAPVQRPPRGPRQETALITRKPELPKGEA